jgi:transposase InsO family protein
MAIWNRTRQGQVLDGLIHHSDRGVQYLAIRYSERLAENDIVTSVGSYDNAAVESFFATLKRELAWIHATKTWATRAALRTALFDYIEGFYNPERIQQRLDYRSPLRFEQAAAA